MSFDFAIESPIFCKTFGQILALKLKLDEEETWDWDFPVSTKSVRIKFFPVFMSKFC